MSDDLQERVELPLGIVVGGGLARVFTLRPARLEDAYRAVALVSPPDDSPSLGERVAYQMAVDDAQILAQVVAVEGVTPVPSLSDLVGAMDPDDMALLRAAAERLKKKLLESRRSLAGFGSPSLPSSGPASP